MAMERTVKLGGNPFTLVGNEVNIGDLAPNFNALTQDLSNFDFYKETKNKVRIISVVPSLDTGVCALQTTRFNQEATNLSEDVFIVTISVDLPFAQKRFCSAEGIQNIAVVSDHRELDFGKKYGFVMSELRLLARGIVIVDKNDIVKYIEVVPEVTEHPNYERALEEVKRLI